MTQRSMPRDTMDSLMFGTGRVRRFTQDSPVLPDVWLEYAKDIGARVDLLLTPWKSDSPVSLAHAVGERLKADRKHVTAVVTGKLIGKREASAAIAANQSSVAVRLTFEELIRVVLPMTDWWSKKIAAHGWDAQLAKPEPRKRLARGMADPENPPAPKKRGAASDEWISADVLWLSRIVGALRVHQNAASGEEEQAIERNLLAALTRPDAPKREQTWLAVAEALAGLMNGTKTAAKGPRVFLVTKNRRAHLSVSRSRVAVKADAARRLFEIDCSNLTWGILDSGVDAAHPAFKDRKSTTGSAAQRSRVRATYDFTEIRELLDVDAETLPPRIAKRLKQQKITAEGLLEKRDELHARIKEALDVNWAELEKFLRIDHRRYEPPENDHGTHVAGILAADWGPKKRDPGFPEDDAIEGVCPDIRLYDFRVFDREGESNEFSIMAALQFVRWLNRTNEYVAVHGVNLSFSIEHDVANYACGRTPVCEESERLIGAGIVVVAAAGNQGHDRAALAASGEESPGGAYHSISITDPGNAEAVITVGATHRYKPHTYGVSYFSSRGPTGDGRSKPDLVAPGEKITGPALRESVATKDGTSQAAPHVSGAAALLMGRYPELIGSPERIKRILCSTATDLGRERYFQGAGMLDVLRALQSV